ncbi:hypothetical protein ACHAWF_007676 [Thalassiosira exigua]
MPSCLHPPPSCHPGLPNNSVNSGMMFEAVTRSPRLRLQLHRSPPLQCARKRRAPPVPRTLLPRDVRCRFASRTKGRREEGQEPRRRFPQAAAASLAVAAAASVYTRRLRDEKLSSLPLARDSKLLSLREERGKYDLPSLVESATRAGLIGSTRSVKDELHVLRRWHAGRGYHGGLAVRDLSRPLFSLDLRDHYSDHEASDDGIDDDDDGDGGGEADDGVFDVDRANRRECYYLYYEIRGDGETRQQLFCRGTTLLADVLTCLRARYVYDDELGCRVHEGFNEHANRIVEDVTPLLVPPAPEGRGRAGNYATVEVCGHSLGGAVAMLVAIKLRKQGHVVTGVTSLAGPRFCRGKEERDILQKWLPKVVAVFVRCHFPITSCIAHLDFAWVLFTRKLHK